MKDSPFFFWIVLWNVSGLLQFIGSLYPSRSSRNSSSTTLIFQYFSMFSLKLLFNSKSAKVNKINCLCSIKVAKTDIKGYKKCHSSTPTGYLLSPVPVICTMTMILYSWAFVSLDTPESLNTWTLVHLNPRTLEPLDPCTISPMPCSCYLELYNFIIDNLQRVGETDGSWLVSCLWWPYYVTHGHFLLGSFSGHQWFNWRVLTPLSLPYSSSCQGMHKP